MPQDIVLSTPAAAAYIGVTENTLRAWAASGKVAHRRTPTGRFRFTREDLDRAVKRIEPVDAA
jgi:excisionase family DNA binding protein